MNQCLYGMFNFRFLLAEARFILYSDLIIIIQKIERIGKIII